MPNDNNNIIIQSVTDNSLTLNINGTIQEISNQLADLRGILQGLNAPTVQYADKIYNIEHINEANFGFITGKKLFNEVVAKQLIVAIEPYSTPARIFLGRIAQTPDWESVQRISDKAKEIIAYSFVGVIGIQLSKLMAIGKEDFSEAKQRKYIEKCLDIVKISLDLVCFALISQLWDAQKLRPRPLSAVQKEVITHRFDGVFESSVGEQFRLLRVLYEIFSKAENGLTLPFPELEGAAEWLQENSNFHQTCQSLQGIQEKLDKSQYDLLDCYEAETQLVAFLKYFPFLANYRMASIKQIGYRQIRNAEPHYLHRYAALGIDSKAHVDAEKMNYTTQTIHTDAVLLYRGEHYSESVNLFPFVIDYNALIFEHGSKICFYRSQEIIDNSLEYVYLDDNNILNLESKGILKPDTDLNELMMDNEDRKTLNLDSVVEQFWEARRCLLGDELNFDDL